MSWIFGSIIVFIAAILQSSIGFGFALLTIPFLLFILPAHLAIAVNIVLSLIVSIGSLPKVWSAINKNFTSKLLAGTILGTPVGFAIYSNFNVQLLKLSTSTIILLLTVLLMLGYNLPMPRKGAAFILGFLGGILGTAVSLPGPPLILYLTAKNAKKDYFAGTALTLFTFSYFLSLVFLIIGNKVPDQLWITSLKLIPFIFPGIIVGSIIRNRINHQLFRNLTYLILLLSSCYSLFTSI